MSLPQAPPPAAADAPPAAPPPPLPGAASRRVPLGVLVAYGLPATGFGYMFFLLTIYLMKFSTDVLLLSPALMGTIFGASRIWDAVSDPLVGYLSDRTQTRLGRRRPWLLGSIPFVAIFFVLAWSPPDALEGAALRAWMTVGVLGFFTAMTILMIPHLSLGAEITEHYHERTRVFGARQLFYNLGAVFSLVAMYALILSDEPRRLALGLAVAASIATGALTAVAVARLRERPELQGRAKAPPLRAYADVWRNPHARLLLVVGLIEALGGATVGVLTPYFAEYVIGMPAQTPLVIGLYVLSGTLSVPVWVRLAGRFGKKPAWLAGMLITALGFGSTFLLGPGDIVPYYAIALVLGTAFGCGNSVGPSVQADVIDWDEHRTGERKEGAYFAAWNFMWKSAAGVTATLTGFTLAAAGFEPNAAQSETSLLAIRALYGFFPLTCYALGAVLFLRFRFNEAEHARIRAEIDGRRR